MVQQSTATRGMWLSATDRVRDPVRVGRSGQSGRLTPVTSLYRTRGGSPRIGASNQTPRAMPFRTAHLSKAQNIPSFLTVVRDSTPRWAATKGRGRGRG